MLQQSTILEEDGQRMPYVFTSGGKRVRSIRRSFEMAWRRAGISGVWCHDLRHTFATNMRRAGVDYFRIMAMTGHRTMEVFMLYHTIDQEDLHQAVMQLDTFMDTTPTSPADVLRNP